MYVEAPMLNPNPCCSLRDKSERVNDKAKKLVIVIIPNPPICIKINIINFPNHVNVVAIFNVLKPVTHTADTVMNNESSYFISSYVAAGNNNRNEPIIIIKIKLRIKIFAGCCFVKR